MSFTKILTIISSVKIVLTLRVKLPCRKCRDWEGHAPCTIGTSKSIVAHWGLLSMHPCAPCKFWLIILLFHVSIKVVFYFVSWFCQSSLVVNFPLMVVPWFSLTMLRTVIVSTNQTKGCDTLYFQPKMDFFYRTFFPLGTFWQLILQVTFLC